MLTDSLKALTFAIGIVSTLPAASASLHVSIQELDSRKAEIDGLFHLHALERGPAQATWLELRPAQIFTADARLVLNDGVDEQVLPPPAVRHYVGSERGQQGALAFVSLHPDGSIRGWLRRGSGMEAFGLEPGQTAPAQIREIDMSAPEVAGRSFECGSHDLPLLVGQAGDDDLRSLSAALDSLRGTQITHVVPVAIDTDLAYLAKFNGDDSAAAHYVADLIGLVSATYAAEVRVSLQLSFVRLWTGNSDPWTESFLGCRLRQFGKHWNDKMTEVPRALAHLLSGGGGGGLAWLGTLCQTNLMQDSPAGCDTLDGPSNYGGHYGVSADISGSLDPGDPQMVWDLLVVAHELGHNFNSPHTHCYANLGGNPDPIDRCYRFESGANCYSGTVVTLPGPQGAGSGTLMSYCHLRPGGVSNVSNTLGTEHPYGVAPGRVPTRMRARVENVAVNFPGCLVTLIDPIFTSGFESVPGS